MNISGKRCLDSTVYTIIGKTWCIKSYAWIKPKMGLIKSVFMFNKVIWRNTELDPHSDKQYTTELNRVSYFICPPSSISPFCLHLFSSLFSVSARASLNFINFCITYSSADICWLARFIYYMSQYRISYMYDVISQYRSNIKKHNIDNINYFIDSL